jgi:type IV fimbrial biogenesis protein FimT
MIPHQATEQHGRHAKGFTLVELVIVLAASAILLSIAVPSFIGLISSNRVYAASNEMVTMLNVAKSEAVRTDQHLVICKSPDGNQCDDSSAWSDGWLLFSDNNDNQAVDDDERIIKVHAATDPRLNFDFNGGDYITFLPTGRTNRNGSFCFTNSYKQENSKKVVITQVGRIRTETFEC